MAAVWADGPTIVYINLMFRDISEINDKEMEYTTMLTFREEWYDDRLRFDGLNGSIKYLTLNDQSKIWLADLFFANERRGHFHKMIIPNVYLRIYPDGWVLYSIRRMDDAGSGLQMEGSRSKRTRRQGQRNGPSGQKTPTASFRAVEVHDARLHEQYYNR